MIGLNTVYDETTESEFFINSVKFTGDKPDFNGCNLFEVDLFPLDDESDLPDLYNVPLIIDYSAGKKECCIALIEEVIDSGAGIYDYRDKATSESLYPAEIKADDEMLVIPVGASQSEGKQNKTLVHITVDDIDHTYNSVHKFIKAVNSLKNVSAGRKISISGVLYNE